MLFTVDAPVSAAAVAKRSDQHRVRHLPVGAVAGHLCLPEMTGRRPGDRRGPTQDGAGPGALSLQIRSVVARGDPMAGVVPRGLRQGHPQSGRGRHGVGPAQAEGGERGVEAEGVVAVARQRAQAVMVRGPKGLGDGVGQDRVGADLDERGVLGGGGGDGLAEPAPAGARWRPSSRRRGRAPSPPGRRWTRTGSSAARGARSASAARSSGRIGSISAVWEATSMLTRRAKRSCAVTAAMTASTGVGRAGDHGLARRDVTRRPDARVVGDADSAVARRRVRGARRRPGRPAGTSAATGGRSPAARRPGSARRPPRRR